MGQYQFDTYMTSPAKCLMPKSRWNSMLLSEGSVCVDNFKNLIQFFMNLRLFYAAFDEGYSQVCSCSDGAFLVSGP